MGRSPSPVESERLKSCARWKYFEVRHQQAPIWGNSCMALVKSFSTTTSHIQQNGRRSCQQSTVYQEKISHWVRCNSASYCRRLAAWYPINGRGRWKAVADVCQYPNITNKSLRGVQIYSWGCLERPIYRFWRLQASCGRNMEVLS